MSSSTRNGNTEVRRPLLANGEKLKQPATRPRGPSSKFHPLTLQAAWEKLAPQAVALTAGIDRMQQGAVGKHLVFEATLLPNYLASTYFPSEVLERGNLYLVGSRPARGTKVTEKKELPDQATRTLMLAGDPRAVRNFVSHLTQEPETTNERDWEQFRRFATVTLPRKENVIVSRPKSIADATTFEAVLTHVYGSQRQEEEWADYHFDQFVDWVAALGGVVDIDYRRDLQGLSFVPVLLPNTALDRVADFNLLRAIRPMPEIAPIPGSIVRTAARAPRPSAMASSGELPEQVIALFDGGVDAALPVFAPFVQSFDLTAEAADPAYLRHGSMVTSAALYGHVRADQDQLPDPLTRVDHYRVFPLPPSVAGQPDHRLYEMLDGMTRVLREVDYSIVALSLGPNEPINDSAEPDRFTSELDLLAFERGITFVTAVGNNGGEDSSLGYDRVQSPGDMVNGIGVGAVSERARNQKKKYSRAPYSARGPGREGQRVQPTVVEFGGCAAEQFGGFDERGRLALACGTSFAGPSSARPLGGLCGMLAAPRRRPDVFRTFAVHFAERGYGHGKKFLELGYGRILAAFDPCFECEPNEVTVLYDDELPRGQSTALRFPFPVGMADPTELELTWTLSFVSEVDPRAGNDYTLSGIETIFRPDSRVRRLTNSNTRESKEVRIDLDQDEIAKALAKGHTLSDEPKAHSNWAVTKREQLLRKDGKWETLLSGRVTATVAELFEPRLDLQHLRREDGHLVGGDAVAPLRYAMLLTLRALDGAEVYEQARAQYNVLAPLVQVPLRVPGVA